ncbi:MBL fold metallo-hydrolase [Pyrofollis japonicus]|uniref:MBL fold metallo-hydrolase n=1 Tax=Pyrofollis japonicus TaxID=3060460 RepID=UPI00295C08A2|nr:MBL fold metallo-hydrolase [Pyrofollis japonicus]BEP17685.1 MBL fold metallo-hydrolase [Pyrofollis japonicus]
MVEVKVKILGADSFGSRSMATSLEVGGVKILIDPGVSYAPRRYGLPPHPVEIARLNEIKERILGEISDADIVIITHYHYDHYLYKPEDVEYYRGKVLLIKDPSSNINVSQRIRAHRLLKTNKVSEIAKSINILDSSTYIVDKDFVVVGSPPVPHGAEGSKLGYVVMVLISCCGEKIVHASDVQGPMSRKALDVILSWKPSLVIISGPPTYFAGIKVEEDKVNQGLSNLRKLVESVDTVIVDHHFARDLNYPSYLEELRSINKRVMSAAEYMGYPIELLEARRKELWKKEKAANSDRASGESFLEVD